MVKTELGNILFKSHVWSFRSKDFQYYRATHYRSNHYRVMSEIGNHIIAFDYRGYGDSSGSPNTHGLVQDVVHIYERIREVCPNNPVTIWGHSMGTGVALLSVNFLYYNQTSML